MRITGEYRPKPGDLVNLLQTFNVASYAEQRQMLTWMQNLAQTQAHELRIRDEKIAELQGKLAAALAAAHRANGGQRDAVGGVTRQHGIRQANRRQHEDVSD